MCVCVNTDSGKCIRKKLCKNDEVCIYKHRTQYSLYASPSLQAVAQWMKQRLFSTEAYAPGIPSFPHSPPTPPATIPAKTYLSTCSGSALGQARGPPPSP